MARESWAFEPLARRVEELDATRVCSVVAAEEAPVTVIGLERFLSEPEALWLMACFTCHPSAAVRLAALSHLAELDGEGWALDYVRLRLDDPDGRVRSLAQARLNRQAP